jgi:DNA (cytosine-5)-methyltransferase 1
MFTFVDLCCGIGGFHQALRRLGGTCLFACDIDAKCRQTYAINYGIEPAGDLFEVSVDAIPAMDVLCAGFPCQPFSKAGSQRGFDDERGNVFARLCRVVEHHRPRFLLFENVRNLASHDGGNTWATMRTHLRSLGYLLHDTPWIVNVLQFNVPQHRERVLIACVRADVGVLRPFPTLPCPNALTCLLPSLIIPGSSAPITGRLAETEKVWNEFLKALYTASVAPPRFPIWTDTWDTDDTTSPFYLKYKRWIDANRAFYATHRVVLEPWLARSRARPLWTGAVRKLEWQAGANAPADGLRSVLWTPRSSGIRVKALNYTPALVAIGNVPIYGPERRPLSGRELLRLQSFPDDFIFDPKTVVKQTGNAVNVHMIEVCARWLISAPDTAT